MNVPVRDPLPGALTGARAATSSGETLVRPGTAARRAGAWLLVAGLALAGCGDGEGPGMPAFLRSADAADAGASAPRASRVGDRDVEAPEVFQVTEAGLWDGRPSLGGVWVAHPDTTDPERVIIRNAETGSSVIGALFRQERATPGPRLQVSSDAAEALGMLAGQPATLDVTALRRAPAEAEEMPRDAAAEAATPAGPDATSDTAAGAPEPVAGASAGPAAAASTTATNVAAIAPARPAAAAASPDLARPFLQIGIFSVEANAQGAAERMRGAGLSAEVRSGTSSDTPFWRVLVGPAASAAERDDMLDTIRAQGFTDAYAVAN